jgi:hypothetical protein
MLCLTSKSYQLCKPRQADIREQLHSLGPKTNVDIVTLNLFWRGPQHSICSRLRPNPVGFKYCAFLRPAFVGVVKAVELPPQHRASEERSFQARPVTPIFDGLQNDCLVCCRPLSNTNLVTVRNALFSSRYWATQTQSDTKTLRCLDRPTYASFTSCFSEFVAAPVRDREEPAAASLVPQ